MRPTTVVKRSSSHFAPHHDIGIDFPKRAAMSVSEEASSPSPSNVALDLHPFLTSIDSISSDHGLSHDSGVSFGMSSRKREALRQEAQSESSSSSSVKQVHAITEEARTKQLVIESPTATSAFDARENVWRDVARRVKPFGDTLRHGELPLLSAAEKGFLCLMSTFLPCRTPSNTTGRVFTE